MKRHVLAALAALSLSVQAHAAQDNYTVRVVAGAAGYDHIQPFIAEYKKIWDKYGVKVDFQGGNYQRSNQLTSIGDYDVGYNQIASSIRFKSAGIDNVIVAASSANCAMIVAGPNINSFADLKGKRIGIVTKFDVQYLTLTKHILPRFGLTEKDVQLVLSPVPETPASLATGNVAAAFPFEPYGTNALEKGAKLLLAPDKLMDKSKLDSDMLRNSMVLNRKFIREHPELAKRLVWAHLDAVHLMRTDRSVALETLKHYVPNIDQALLEKSYDNCGWTYNEVPRAWIDALIGWMKEDGLIQKPVTYEEVVDQSFAKSYPGYPGWEKLK
jgi:ABC-type nitrate/sulfonate/bicarbonate transport system substrate-binding protein